MKHTHKIAFTALLFAALFALLLGCDLNANTSSTWTFENSASGLSYIEVTIKNDDSPSSFTLYYGQTQDVTWTGQGDDYRGGYSYTAYCPSGSSAKGAYTKQYDALKNISFYTQY